MEKIIYLYNFLQSMKPFALSSSVLLCVGLVFLHISRVHILITQENNKSQLQLLTGKYNFYLDKHVTEIERHERVPYSPSAHGNNTEQKLLIFIITELETTGKFYSPIVCKN